MLLRIRIDKDVDAAIVEPLSKILGPNLLLVEFVCLSIGFEVNCEESLMLALLVLVS